MYSYSNTLSSYENATEGGAVRESWSYLSGPQWNAECDQDTALLKLNDELEERVWKGATEGGVE